MTILLNETTTLFAMSELGPRAAPMGGNFALAMNKIGEGMWHIAYRFRYIVDTLSWPDTKDILNWYEMFNQNPETEEEAIERCRQVIDIAMRKMPGLFLNPIVLERRDYESEKEFMEAITTLPGMVLGPTMKEEKLH